jgi:exodeoxyribonuclease VII large subunit
LATASKRLARSLTSRLQFATERTARTTDRLAAAIQSQLDRRTTRLEQAAAKLDALSPLEVLGRGYAVARDESGGVLKRAADFAPGLKFRLTLADGDVRAETLGSDQ